jgi:hypothetical protein
VTAEIMERQFRHRCVMLQVLNGHVDHRAVFLTSRYEAADELDALRQVTEWPRLKALLAQFALTPPVEAVKGE